MAENDPASDPIPTFSTTRLEAFSDGVFAIAITLLVLELTVHPPGSPLELLAHEWPSYFAYVVSFLTIGAAWLGHNELTDRLTKADTILLRLNLLLLLAVTFLPFPTRLVAESLAGLHGERAYVTLYGLTLLMIRVFGFALDRYAGREHLYTTAGETAERAEERRLLSVVLGYIVAIGVGMVFPGLAVAFYFGIAVYLVVPFREIGRLLFGRS
jgi:uncharacterized membrane protein